MERIRPEALTIGTDAVGALIQYCQSKRYTRLLIVADRNTYAALGHRVHQVLDAESFDTRLVYFDHPEVVADAHHILDILIAANNEDRIFLAVGSGTITDLVRFSSHRSGVPFISLPTAPSVDGFTSIGAPTIVRGIKKTLVSQPPVAIFADLDTLRRAPRRLMAAGFGDMMGKFTSAADFKLGHLLWNEPFDSEIAERTRESAQTCVDNLESIATASEEGMRILFDALVESGYCMLDFGESRPASGAEHHISHFAEMKLLQGGKPAVLHGAKVGAATIRVAQLYDQVKSLSQAQVAQLMEVAEPPNPDVEKLAIRDAYGELAEPLLKGQLPYIEIDHKVYEDIQKRIIDNWADIQAIAAQVPSAADVTRWLQAVGGAIQAKDLGISEADFEEAYNNGHYLRERFTIRKMMHLFFKGAV
ncbi:MAG: sn-glycerol-1-phosphate dehydrogenase [Chloroflexota bacterium]